MARLIPGAPPTPCAAVGARSTLEEARELWWRREESQQGRDRGQGAEGELFEEVTEGFLEGLVHLSHVGLVDRILMREGGRSVGRPARSRQHERDDELTCCW
jgi:hypothetical protein